MQRLLQISGITGIGVTIPIIVAPSAYGKTFYLTHTHTERERERESRMTFIHSREYLNRGDIVRLDCDTQCNFMITTDTNFSSYRNRRSYQHYGGHYRYFPAQIVVPH